MDDDLLREKASLGDNSNIKVADSAATKADSVPVTLKDAKLGLKKAIMFLEAHNEKAGNCIATLWSVLNHMNKFFNEAEEASSDKAFSRSNDLVTDNSLGIVGVPRGNKDKGEPHEMSCTQGIIKVISNSILRTKSSESHNVAIHASIMDDGTSHRKKGSKPLPSSNDTMPQHSTDTRNTTDFSCLVCQQTFKRVGFLHRHMIECHHEACKGRETSNLCSSSAMLNLNNLRSSESETADKGSLVCGLKQCQNSWENRTNDARETFCRCPICNLHFSSSKDLNRHRRNERHYVCAACGEGFKSTALLISHMNGHAEKSFICPVCGRSFTVARSLVIHTKVHTGEQLYKCAQCEKSFVLKTDMKRHMRVHTLERPHACSICASSFYLAWELKTHHTRCHSEERRFLCNTCGKSFRSSGHLRQHSLVHSGQKPYVCKLCSKSYCSSGGLHIHMRSHHGQRPAKCSLCDKRFIHTSDLKRHMVTHTGEKRHQCNECGKCFTQASNLQTHMRTHTGQKPFKCPVCFNCFGHAVTLKGHMKLHQK